MNCLKGSPLVFLVLSLPLPPSPPCRGTVRMLACIVINKVDVDLRRKLCDPITENRSQSKGPVQVHSALKPSHGI
jgi:hypothetical protein